MNYFDCHADTLTAIAGEGETLLRNTCDVDLTRTGAFADRYTQVFAIFADVDSIPPADREARFLAAYDKAKSLIEAQAERISLVRTAEEMRAAHDAGKAAAFLSIEDASYMGSFAPQAFELGFRFAMLVWNNDNEYACGSVSNQRKGLTEAGRKLVRTYLDHGVVMDISHLSDAGADELFSMTDDPIIASHSNARDVCDVPRNLARWQIEELVRRKGLIGLNLFGAFVADHDPAIDDVLRHADRILELGGEDVLACGADFDGCNGYFPARVEGVQTMPVLRQEFADRFGDRLAEKIFFSNAAAFVDRVL